MKKECYLKRVMLAISLIFVLLLSSADNFSIGLTVQASGETVVAYECDDAGSVDVTDHDLSEWEDVPKTYFTGSLTDYFQIMWSGNRLYFAVSANDSGKTSDGLWRDQVRVGVTLPGGETGLALFGADADDSTCWASVDQAEIYRWWGETGLTSIFKPQDSTARFTWANGRVAAEGSLNFDSTYKSALRRSETIKLAIRYYDNAQVNTVSNYDSRMTWGGNTNKVTDSLASFGYVLLAVRPIPPPPSARAFSVTDNEMSADGDLSEWAGIPKNVFTDIGSMYDGNEEDSFQLAYSENRLYFAMIVTDSALNHTGGQRDQVRVAVTIPGLDLTGAVFFGADAAGPLYCWRSVDQGELSRWWGETGLASLFQSSDTYTRFNFVPYTNGDSGGKMHVEGSIHFDNAYKSALVMGGTLKVSIQYLSNTGPDTNIPVDFRNRWGNIATSNIAGNLSGYGTVILGGAVPDATSNWIRDSGISVDSNLSEWADQAKNYFVGSRTDYFQLRWSKNRLYFTAAATDPGKTRDGINCDQIRLAVTIPGTPSLTGLAFFGADQANDGCWASVNQLEIAGWWGEDVLALTSLFKQEDSYARFNWTGGRVYIEGCLNFEDDYKSALTQDEEIKLSIRYYNNVAVNANTPFTTRVDWGNANTPGIAGNLNNSGIVYLHKNNADPDEEVSQGIKDVLLKRVTPEAAGLADEYPGAALDITFLLNVKQYLLAEDNVISNSSEFSLMALGSQYPQYKFSYQEIEAQRVADSRWLVQDLGVQELSGFMLERVPVNQKYDWGQSIIKVGNTYKMWWTRENPKDTVWYAESKDMKHWTTPQMVIAYSGYQPNTTWIKEMIGWPDVVFVNGTYYMFFEAPCRYERNPGNNNRYEEYANNIFLATSADGINWTMYPNNTEPVPILKTPLVQMGIYGVGQPDAFYKNGRFYIAYTDSSGGQTVTRLAMSEPNNAASIVNANDISQHPVILNGGGASVRYNSVTNKYYCVWSYNQSGSDNLYIMETDNINHWPYRDRKVAAQSLKPINTSDTALRMCVDFAANEHGIIDTPTMFMLYTQGVMPPPGEDHRDAYATWDLYFTALNPKENFKKSMILPNQTMANAKNLKAYRTVIAERR